MNSKNVINPNGINYTYYNSGAKYKEYYKINNKREGEFKKFNLNGDLIYICNYVNNRKNGEELNYYYNNPNVLESKTNYVNGKRNGIYIVYDERGEMINETFYIDDKEVR
jgi:antitoxin component YwqK of YwqJK toxin-antitoxin module